MASDPHKYDPFGDIQPTGTSTPRNIEFDGGESFDPFDDIQPPVAPAPSRSFVDEFYPGGAVADFSERAIEAFRPVGEVIGAPKKWLDEAVAAQLPGVAAHPGNEAGQAALATFADPLGMAGAVSNRLIGTEFPTVATHADERRRAIEELATEHPDAARYAANVEAGAEGVGEFLGGVVSDPTMLAFGAASKLGQLPGLIGKGARLVEGGIGASFLPSMAEGFGAGAGQAIGEYERTGQVTPEVVRAGVEALGSGAMAGLGGLGLAHGLGVGRRRAIERPIEEPRPVEEVIPEEVPFAPVNEPFPVPEGRAIEFGEPNVTAFNYEEAPPVPRGTVFEGEAPPQPVFRPETPPMDVLAEREFLRPDMEAQVGAEQARLGREYLADRRAPIPAETIEGAIAPEGQPRLVPTKLQARDAKELGMIVPKLGKIPDAELAARERMYRREGLQDAGDAVREEMAKRAETALPEPPEPPQEAIPEPVEARPVPEEIVPPRATEPVEGISPEVAPLEVEAPRGADRRVEAAPVADDRRVAQRRAVAQEIGLPEDHPAVERVLAAEEKASEVGKPPKIDALTGLRTVRAYEEVKASLPPDHGVTFFDLQGFKAVNDKFGHKAGDMVLQRVADVLTEMAGPDNAYRRTGGIAGDEFFATHPLSEAVGERLQKRLASERVMMQHPDGRTVEVTDSIRAHFGTGATLDQADIAANVSRAAKGRDVGEAVVPVAEPGTPAALGRGLRDRASRPAEELAASPDALTPPAEPPKYSVQSDASARVRRMRDTETALDLQSNPADLKFRKGRLYEVDLKPSEDEYLLWDKPLSEQSEKVFAALDGDPTLRRYKMKPNPTGGEIVQSLGTSPNGGFGPGAEGTSMHLRKLGIPGIKYLDQSSRGAGEGSHNYVLFDDSQVETTAKYGRKADELSGIPISKEHIQAAFQSGKVEQLSSGAWRVDLPGDRRIQVVLRPDGIEYRPDAFRTGYGREKLEGEQIIGRWQKVDRGGVVWLAKEADQGTIHHEAFHGAMDLALNEKERAAVLKKYGNEEAAAEAYAKWTPATTNSWFSKILQTFKRLYRSFRPNWESAFERTRSGEAFGKATEITETGPKFASKEAPFESLIGQQKHRLELANELNAVNAHIQVRARGYKSQSDVPIETLYKQQDELTAALRETDDQIKLLKSLRIAPDATPNQPKYATAPSQPPKKGGGFTFEEEPFQIKTGPQPVKARGPQPVPPAARAPQPQAGAPTAPPARTQAGTTPAQPTRTFAIPEETKLQKIQRVIQDKFNRVSTVQESVRKQGGAVREDIKGLVDAYTPKAAEAIRDVEAKYVDPLVSTLAKDGVSLQDLDRYLYAKHAPQRNKVIADRTDGAVSDGSGLSDQAAGQILADLQRQGKTQKLQRAEKFVRDMRDEQVRILLDGGLISQEQANAWRTTMGDDYVPLRTAEIDEGIGTGQGFDIRGREAKAATGRKNLADSPATAMVQQLQRAIVRAEKNKVDQAFAKFVEDNPDPTLWELDKAHTKTELGPGGKVRQIGDALAAKDDFHYKVDGEAKRITLHDPLLDRAMKNLSAKETGVIVNHLGKATRLFSTMVTSWNPEFIATNFARDVQTALGNVTAEQGPKIARNMVKGIPGAMVGMYRSVRNPNAAPKSAKGRAWVQAAKDFRKDGGAVGWFSIKDLSTLERELNRKVGRSGPGAVNALKRALPSVRQLIEDVNKAVESGSRLALYKAMRDSGVAREKAAGVARNVTVDFNKKGEAGPTLNALYAFLNASIQGTKRFADLAKSPGGRKVAAGIMASGFALDQYNRSVAGDANNDGTNDYDDIPEYVKERNLVIMRQGDKKPILIPLPYGFNAVHTMGRLMSGVYTGEIKPQKAAAAMASAVWNAFNPLGGESESDIVQVLAPTFADPIVQHSMNRDFTGRPLKPEGFPGAAKKPGSEQYFKSVSPVAREVARFLNEKTRGDRVAPGYVSVSPEIIEHYWNFATGGLGRFVGNTVTTGAQIAEGETPSIRNVPFARRFLYEPSKGLEGSKYRENSEELETLWKQYTEYRKAGEREKASQIPIDMLRAKRYVDQIDRQIQAIRRAERVVPNAEERIGDLYAKANRLVAGARKAAERSAR